MTCARLRALAVLGPGLDGWPAARAVLAGGAPYIKECFVRPAATALPSMERRRSTALVRLAVQAASDAVVQAGAQSAELATVFCSSAGDSDVTDQLCSALAMPDRPVSPTRFHNSVHNAPAGYWSIATGSRLPSTSLACYDGSFAAGLIEASSQAVCDGDDVLLVAYDLPPPAPLSAAREISDPFAVAMLISAVERPGDLATLTVSLQPDAVPHVMREAALEQLRLANPAARCLPLLAAIAAAAPRTIVLDYLHDCALQVEVTPCA